MKSLALLITAAVILGDQTLKWLSFALPETGVRLFPGATAVRFINPGLAGSIAVPETVLIPLVIVALAFVANGLRGALRSGKKSSTVGWCLILGGGISNVADRILREGVLDVLRLGPMSYTNLADISVVAGIIIILISKSSNISKLGEESV